MRRDYVMSTITALKSEQFFQFAPYGTAIWKCIHKERNLIVYYNVITGTVKRFTELVVVDKKKQICKIRYVKIVDGFLDTYYNNRRELEDLPF